MIKKYKPANVDVVEKDLRKLLTQLCRSVGLSLSEWNVDKSLHNAIKTRPEWVVKSEKTRHKYDQLIETSEKMKLNIEEKWYWFYQLCK